MKMYKIWPLVIGVLFITCNNRDEKFDNIKRYYPGGTLKSEINLKNGVKSGMAKTFYPNGVLKEKYSYRENLLDGAYENYDGNGQLITRGYFLKGKASGPSFYYRNGKLVLYNERDFNGVYYAKKYDSTGNIVKEQGYAVSPDFYVLPKQEHYHRDQRIQVQFFYSEPAGFANYLNTTINGSNVSLKRYENHMLELDTIFNKAGSYRIEVIGSLNKDKKSVFSDTTIATLYVQ